MTSFETNDDEYFISKARSAKCKSIGLHEELIEKAVRKNGRQRNSDDDNLLFPPSVIQAAIVKANVQNILSCSCNICRLVPGRDTQDDNILADAIPSREEKRLVFAALVHIGAAFAARHMCSYQTKGLDIQSLEESHQAELFKPLREAFPDEPATRFTKIFRKAFRLFNSPKLELGSEETNLTGSNLPFRFESLLRNENSSFGRLWTFQIHPEFCGETWRNSETPPVIPPPQIMKFIAKLFL